MANWIKISTLLDFVRDELDEGDGIVFYARSGKDGGAEYLDVGKNTIPESLNHLKWNAEQKGIK